ncbi:chloramphenicol phosphotransferase CPT [Streptomyces sp. NPDC002773]|uniref:chloramphenicol phosphotransferase CPT n=1 Tax=Streptomyces sp. NPDC002773 TaxID=3154430 RepID=UPI003328EADF
MIILNGGSSAGKSAIVRSLQTVLPDPWLAFGVDSLIDAMPLRMQGSDAGIEFAPDGGVNIGADFRTLEGAWATGIAAMARAGARIIVDDVFLSGAAAQDRWRTFVGDLDVLWVGVHCAGPVAEAREAARGDRVTGMAAKQATTVHDGVTYDLEVDTTRTDSQTCARTIAARVTTAVQV